MEVKDNVTHFSWVIEQSCLWLSTAN